MRGNAPAIRLMASQIVRYRLFAVDGRVARETLSCPRVAMETVNGVELM